MIGRGTRPAGRSIASVAAELRPVPVLPSPPPRPPPSPPPAARPPHAAPAPPLATAWPAGRTSHAQPSSRGQMCSLGGWTRGCRPTARPCYFLLSCCCCGCSWTKCVAARESDAAADPEKKPREPTATDPLLCEGEAPPSMDEIQSWGKSFDHLMRNAAGRKVFRDFLRGEYSEENIMFWLACEELKRETDPDAVEEKARFIYEDYISILSPKEVSLDSHVREIVNRNMVEPTPHTFDEAQLQIYTLMHRDSYPRFVNSTIYKTLAAINDEPAAL